MLPKTSMNTASIEPIINNFKNRIENPETSPITVNSIAGGLSLPPLPSQMNGNVLDND